MMSKHGDGRWYLGGIHESNMLASGAHLLSMAVWNWMDKMKTIFPHIYFACLLHLTGWAFGFERRDLAAAQR
jgi:hypothetical protein